MPTIRLPRGRSLAVIVASLALAGNAAADTALPVPPAGHLRALTALLLDPARRSELGARARAVATRYEWSAIGDSFRRILENVARG